MHHLVGMLCIKVKTSKQSHASFVVERQIKLEDLHTKLQAFDANSTDKDYRISYEDRDDNVIDIHTQEDLVAAIYQSEALSHFHPVLRLTIHSPTEPQSSHFLAKNVDVIAEPSSLHGEPMSPSSPHRRLVESLSAVFRYIIVSSGLFCGILAAFLIAWRWSFLLLPIVVYYFFCYQKTGLDILRGIYYQCCDLYCCDLGQCFSILTARVQKRVKRVDIRQIPQHRKAHTI